MCEIASAHPFPSTELRSSLSAYRADTSSRATFAARLAA